MTSMLAPILEATRHRVANLPPLNDLRATAAEQPPARDFVAALEAPGLSVVAEIKRRSPSAGEIDAGLDPAAQATLYEDGGAAAISVLTEPEFFNGSLNDLVAVRQAVGLPVLRKDFTLEPSQVFESRAHGADAVLLIVAALSVAQLEELLAAASDAGCSAVVEVHSADELDVALTLGVTVVGVNNRDLTNFRTDLAVAERLAAAANTVRVTIAESGVSDRAGASRMHRAGYDAILVGEALVRAVDPAALISDLCDHSG